MNAIYDKLLSELSNSYQFLHQKAKGKLIIAQVQVKNMNRYMENRTLTEAVYNITRAQDLASQYPDAKNIDEAPYVKTLERLMEMQEELDEKLSLLLALKAELTEVIDGVENMDERLVLTYRYLKNFTWSHIGDILCADERTVRRWHSLALAHVIVPENPTVIP